MKTSHDPRHKHRIKVMRELFAWSFHENAVEDETTKQIIENLAKIDSFIEKAAPTWPISKINQIDLAILRLAVYELLIDSKVPSKVVVDEAVEIAKEYGSDASSAFINGALGKLISEPHIAQES